MGFEVKVCSAKTHSNRQTPKRWQNLKCWLLANDVGNVYLETYSGPTEILWEHALYASVTYNASSHCQLNIPWLWGVYNKFLANTEILKSGKITKGLKF